MKKIFQILIIVCGGLIMNSCYYDELQERPIPELPSDVEILFGTDIQPIFTASCIGCHNDSRNPDLREGYSYSSLVPEYVIANDAEASRLYTKLAGGHQNLATAKISLIKTWINQGAKNN
ncbi:MAG: hypothetical protein WC389_04785 [Lutibacter sp.]|jgi:hypothetical protein